MKLAFHKLTQTWYRPGTGDEYILNESFKGSWEELKPLSGDTILDIGAHIGTAAQKFIKNGAQVIAIEADPRLLELFKLNAPTAKFYSGLASRYNSTQKFYLDPNGSWEQSTSKSDDKIEILLPTIDISRHFHRVNKIKCDIEGGEYSIPWDLITPNISKIGIEFHDVIDNHKNVLKIKNTLFKLGFQESPSENTAPSRVGDSISFFSR